jgi:hypothetical protein
MPKPLQFKLSISPQDRIVPININEDTDSCGGYVGAYKSLCNFYTSPVNFDVCWHFLHLPNR